MELFEKFFIARTVLALSQQEAAEQAGIKQATVSILERGGRDAVPEAYIQFLYTKGIDMNWLFNTDENTRNVFRKVKHISKSDKGLSEETDVTVDKNVFLNQELLETKKLTYSGIKHVDKVLVELLTEIKKLNSGLLQHTSDNGK